MKTQEILTIIAISSLGLCLFCSLAKALMKKGDKGKKHCDKVCGAFVFLAIILLAVSQLMGEEEKMTEKSCESPVCPDGSSNSFTLHQGGIFTEPPTAGLSQGYVCSSPGVIDLGADPCPNCTQKGCVKPGDPKFKTVTNKYAADGTVVKGEYCCEAQG